MQRRAPPREAVVEVVRTVPVEPLSGETLFGRYHLCETIVKRGNSKVTKAYDTTSGQYVAVKEVNVREVGDWKLFNSMTTREAEALSNLDHPNIVKLVEFRASDTENKAWIVTPWVDGQDLGQFLDRGGRLTKDQIKSIMHQVLDALDYMHSIHPPIIHRDIKPENIMVDKDGVATVVDFGFALSQTSSGTTVFGVTSPGYSAPEVAVGRTNAIGPSSDLYSAVAVYYRLVAGHDANGLDKLGSCGLTRRQRKLISKGLDDKPENRYRSATEVRKALEKAEGKRENNFSLEGQIETAEGMTRFQIIVAVFLPVVLMNRKLAEAIVNSPAASILPRARRERLAAKAGVDLAQLEAGYTRLQLGSGKSPHAIEIVAEVEVGPEKRKATLIEKLNRIRDEKLIPDDTETRLRQRMIAKQLGFGRLTNEEIADCIILEIITDDEAQAILLEQLGIPGGVRGIESEPDYVAYANEIFDIVSTKKLGAKAQEKAIEIISPHWKDLRRMEGSRTNQFTLLDSGGITVHKLQDELANGIDDSDQASHLVLYSKVTSLEARKTLIDKCEDHITLRKVFLQNDNTEILARTAGKLTSADYDEIYAPLSKQAEETVGTVLTSTLHKIAAHAPKEFVRCINADTARREIVVTRCLEAVELEFPANIQLYLVQMVRYRATQIADLGTVTAKEAVDELAKKGANLNDDEIITRRSVFFALLRIYYLDNEMYRSPDENRDRRRIDGLRSMVNIEITRLKVDKNLPNRRGRAKTYLAVLDGKTSRIHNFMGSERRDLESIE